ncbi:MAG: S26 family signal peptidase [Clostridia bacterium]|nr:S26 family signal peptidase [Clostridia bacterium]
MDENISTFEEVLNRDGRLIYTNVGISMLPLICEGRDVLTIEKCDTSSLKKYDVVLFRRKNVKGRGKYILHRIIKFLPGNRFWIVGDNCAEGETVDADMILGVLKGIYRNNKLVNFNGIGYRCYVCFWCAPYPLRFILIKAKAFFIRGIRAVAHKLTYKRH